MSAEIWVAIIGLAGIIVTALLGPAILEWTKKRLHTEPPRIEPEPDPFKERYFARVEVLEAEVKSERALKTECLIQCARLKSELDAAERRATADAETIRRLRDRVDRLERRLRHDGR